MCMQCVRADRREAEGRPARWRQRQARVLFVDELSTAPAQLEGGNDMSPLLRDARFRRGA